jgi:predicted DNA-binding protein
MLKARYSKLLTISVSQAVFQRIKEISDLKEVSMSEVVRDAINLGLREVDDHDNK